MIDYKFDQRFLSIMLDFFKAAGTALLVHVA